MFYSYDDVDFRNSTPIGNTYDAKSLSDRLKPFYSQGWNSKKIAEKAGISSITSVHKASQGQLITGKKLVDGQWVKIIDHETLSQLIDFLENWDGDYRSK